MTAHIVFNLRSLIWGMGWWKLYDCSWRHFRARKCLIKRALMTFSSIFNCVAAIWKGNFSTSPQLWRQERHEGWEWSHSIACPWILVSSLLSHVTHLLRFLSYLAGSKSVFVCPPTGLSNQVTMTIDALKGKVSSSCKNNSTPNDNIALLTSNIRHQKLQV